MDDLRCVRYDNAAAIVEATKQYDDGFMNLALGSLHDYLRDATATHSSDSAYFLALYRGDELLFILTHHPLSQTWQLICPQAAEHLLTPSLLDVATRLLASTLLEAAHPNVISNVYGHEAAVNAFLNAWAALVATRGMLLHIADPLMTTHSSYATRDSLPPLPATPSDFVITLGNEHDFEDVLPLYLGFLAGGPIHRSLDVEKAFLRHTLATGLLWICRAGGATAGYVLLSRVSPRTIAIRSVYVSPEHRRKGVAETMVRAMARYHLGVKPVGYEGVPDEPPATGVKDIICINVALPEIERIYRRAGFLFPECGEDGSLRGGRDPVSGLKAWFPSLWRGFKPQSAP